MKKLSDEWINAVGKPMSIAVDLIIVNLWVRTHIPAELVKDYAERMTEQGLPPILVSTTKTGEYCLVDGRIRRAAATSQYLDAKTMDCIVLPELTEFEIKTLGFRKNMGIGLTMSPKEQVNFVAGLIAEGRTKHSIIASISPSCFPPQMAGKIYERALKSHKALQTILAKQMSQEGKTILEIADALKLDADVVKKMVNGGPPASTSALFSKFQNDMKTFGGAWLKFGSRCGKGVLEHFGKAQLTDSQVGSLFQQGDKVSACWTRNWSEWKSRFWNKRETRNGMISVQKLPFGTVIKPGMPPSDARKILEATREQAPREVHTST